MAEEIGGEPRDAFQGKQMIKTFKKKGVTDQKTVVNKLRKVKIEI